MPKIEVPQSKRLPTTEAQPRIPAGMFTEQFAAQRGMARAIGQAGQVAGQAAINTIRAQGEEEFTKANLGYATEFRKFQDELLTDTDYAGYTKKFNDWHDNITTGLSKQINHRGAQSRAKLKFDTLRATSGAKIDAFAQRTLVTETRRLMPDKLEGFLTAYLHTESGSQEQENAVAEREEYFKMLRETEVFSDDEMDAWEVEYQELKGERLLENTVRAMAVEEPRGWDAVEEWLSDPKNATKLFKDFGVKLADEGKILNLVKQKASRTRASGIITLVREREATGNSFIKRLDALVRGTDKGTDDSFDNLLDDIINSELTPTGLNSKSSWLDKVNNASDAINSGKENPLNQSDPLVWKPLRIRADNDPGSITIAEITDLWGKGKKGGINEDQYKTILGMITDKDDPLNTNSSRRAQSSFGRMRENELNIYVGPAVDRTDEDTPEINRIEDRWLRISNENDAYLKSEEGRKATDEQREKKRQTLARPAIEEITLGWYEGWFWRRKPELIHERKQQLRRQSEFKKFTSAEQERAIDLIESGLTVNQAVVETLKKVEKFKYTAIDEKTGKRMGSDDGVKWQPIP